MTIQQIQNLLQYLGYYTIQVDGLPGPGTTEAVRNFQKDFGGIAVDGVPGPATQKALKHAIAYGIEKKPDTSEPGGSQTNTGNAQTGTFWDDIQYFTREEFRCQCKGRYCNGFPYEPEETLVKICDEIRRRAGVPVSIVTAGGSGVRCPTHNANVGGVSNSLHLYGKAADLHSSLSPQQLKAIAEDVTAEMIPGQGGIGLYSWGIHVDTGKYSRWNG